MTHPSYVALVLRCILTFAILDFKQLSLPTYLLIGISIVARKNIKSVRKLFVVSGTVHLSLVVKKNKS